ncbi:hypothetical protein GCM10011576_61320 [Micromonospora parathelypteridis]|nr:hypothetical protein GCM10011576_61320 [Micromonospora parathelypteridis]
MFVTLPARGGVSMASAAWTSAAWAASGDTGACEGLNEPTGCPNRGGLCFVKDTEDVTEGTLLWPVGSEC